LNVVVDLTLSTHFVAQMNSGFFGIANFLCCNRKLRIMLLNRLRLNIHGFVNEHFRWVDDADCPMCVLG
jgi:hypothetical protein